MSTAAVADTVAAPARPGGRRRLLLLAAPVLVAAIGAALWFGGVLPPLLGLARPAGAAPGHAAAAPDPAAPPQPAPALDLPEMVANLNAAPSRRVSFIKLRARIELGRPEDVVIAQANLPRLLDLFQTYLREMRPEELRGSAGSLAAARGADRPRQHRHRPGSRHRRAVHRNAGAMMPMVRSAHRRPGRGAPRAGLAGRPRARQSSMPARLPRPACRSKGAPA